MLIGFFLGRLTMAVQYAIFKEMEFRKRKDLEGKLKGKIDKISPEGFHT